MRRRKNTKIPLYLSLIELKNSLQVNSLSSLLTEDSLPYSFSDGMPCDLTIPFSHFSRPNYFLRIRKRNRISFMNEKKLNRIKRRWERCVGGGTGLALVQDLSSGIPKVIHRISIYIIYILYLF